MCATRIVASGRQRQVDFEYHCECGDAASAIQTARLHLVSLNRDWLIDDVRRDKRSVRALLRRELTIRRTTKTIDAFEIEPRD